MRFVTIRELRSKAAAIRKELEAEREIIITANGHPFALLSRLNPEAVEDELMAVRQARARIALDRIRASAKASGRDRMSMAQIDAVIAKVRRRRRARQ